MRGKDDNLKKTAFSFQFISLNKDFYENTYNQCIISCPHGDYNCITGCARDYETNINLCPCQSGCQKGCPCSDYVCPTTAPSTTTTTRTTTTTAFVPGTDILILSTINKLNVPIITNASGREDRNFYFEYGEGVQVTRSCGLTWRNEHYIFGGGIHENDDPMDPSDVKWRTQISKIVNCQLKKIAELPFDHDEAGCTNVSDRIIYLCFNIEGNYKKCRMADSPTGKFQEIKESTHPHRAIRLASSECKNLLLVHSTI